MNRRIIVYAVTAVLSVLFFSAGCESMVAGSGNHVTGTFDYTGFTGVEAQSGFRVNITQSSSFSIEVTADDNLREYLDIGLTDETLVLGLTSKSCRFTVLEATITMPGISGINLSGGSRAEITGFSSSDDFSATLSGGSILDGDIVSGDIGFGLSGGSSVRLNGSGGDMVARSSGGSHMDLEYFPIQNADINISGGGTASLTMNGRLDTDLSAGSGIVYGGDPEMGNVNLSGGSTLKKR